VGGTDVVSAMGLLCAAQKSAVGLAKMLSSLFMIVGFSNWARDSILRDRLRCLQRVLLVIRRQLLDHGVP